jgi:FixJ family two-component response regulator
MTHRALVHVVAVEQEVQHLLGTWLQAEGIDTRSYPHLGAFLGQGPGDGAASPPGCLVIDAQPTAICGCEAQAILLPLAIRQPIVVVERPLNQLKAVAAIVGAVEVDRRLRLAQSRCAQIEARYGTLTRRERQVMALVVDGLLNKQIGWDLGVSEITVKAHRGSVMRKMGARSLAELVRMADAIADCAAGERDRARSARSTPARSVSCADLRSGYSLDQR